MMNKDVNIMFENVLPVAAQAFGQRAQMIKACEEMGELTQALCKRLNGSPIDDSKIIDEIADVLVIANQMRFYFGEAKVDERMIYKMHRTANFILAAKKESNTK